MNLVLVMAHLVQCLVQRCIYCIIQDNAQQQSSVAQCLNLWPFNPPTLPSCLTKAGEEGQANAGLEMADMIYVKNGSIEMVFVHPSIIIKQGRLGTWVHSNLAWVVLSCVELHGYYDPELLLLHCGIELSEKAKDVGMRTSSCSNVSISIKILW